MSKLWITVIAAGITLFLAACQQKPAEPDLEAGDELPTQAITRWSGRTELFLEHPPLVAGGQSKFSVHLTDLKTYRPLKEGRITLEMEAGGKVARFESLAPSRPGIFRIDVTAGRAGRYRSVLRLDAPGCRDEHALGELTVYPDIRTAARELGQEDPGDAIAYLKEQQWNSEFATETAAIRVIPEYLAVPAAVAIRGGAEGSALSPVRGQVLRSPPLPLPGQEVRQGDVVAAILPLTSRAQDEADLRLELAQAETDLDLARRERERLEGLLAEGVIPARRAELARADERRAQARLEAAQDRLAQYEQSRLHPEDESRILASAFQVRAPISGVVAALSAVNGGLVEAEQELVRIVDLSRVWVSVQVPESAAARLAELRGVELDVPGESAPAAIPGPRGRIVRQGFRVDPQTRRIPVILEVANPNRLLRLDQVVPARLILGDRKPRLAVPVAALVEDGGQSVVYIQESGEGFIRRPVQTGPSGGGYAVVLQGLSAGERVVSRGAYAIRLASLSSQVPAHGHVH